MYRSENNFIEPLKSNYVERWQNCTKFWHSSNQFEF